MNDFWFIVCCLVLGFITGIILIVIAMIKKGLSATGSAVFTRDGHYQDMD